MISIIKRTWFLIVSILLLNSWMALSQQKTNVEIAGVVENGFDENTVFFLESFDANKTKLAEGKVDENGSYIIRAFLDDINFYKLGTGDNNFIVMILKPGDKIGIRMSGTSFREVIGVDGSEDVEVLFQAGKTSFAYEYKIDSLNKAFKSLRSNPEKQAEIQQINDQLTQTRNEYKKYISAFLQKHNSSLASLFFVDKLPADEFLPLLEKVDEGLMAKYPQNPYVKNFHNKIALEKRVGIGSIAPDIELQDPSGKPVRLSSLRGKIVLVDFWASWCGPCRRENPNVVRLYNQYKEKGFTVFGVSLDSNRESWIAAIEKDNLDWTHVSDLKKWKSEVVSLYNFNAIPFTVLVDREGRIIGKNLRGGSLESKLSELLDN